MGLSSVFETNVIGSLRTEDGQFELKKEDNNMKKAKSLVIYLLNVLSLMVLVGGGGQMLYSMSNQTYTSWLKSDMGVEVGLGLVVIGVIGFIGTAVFIKSHL